MTRVRAPRDHFPAPTLALPQGLCWDPGNASDEGRQTVAECGCTAQRWDWSPDHSSAGLHCACALIAFRAAG